MDGDKAGESLVISISFFANYEYKKILSIYKKIPVRIKWNHGEIQFSTPGSVMYMSILFHVVVAVYQFGYLGDEIKGRKT